MFNCSKCGSSDVKLRHIAYGEEWSGTSKNCGDFVSVSYEGYAVSRAKKEHLKCECSTCGYVWRKETLDKENENV